jgi:hypothetical protein
MTLRVHTARINSRDPDRLDVTWAGNRKFSHRGVGGAFAPSGALFWPYVRKRQANALVESDWVDYVAGYTREMRRSYVAQRPAWDTILSWPRVVLVCFCAEAERCHRRILAECLRRCGAIDQGELVLPHSIGGHG